MSSIQISDRIISDDSPVFIIAELSANHNHDIQVAKDTIVAAKEAGADAIKLQTYTANTITLDVKNDYFKLSHGTIWDGKYLYELYQQAYTPWEWHEELFALAQEQGLICFSSPFDITAVDLLEKLEAPAYKIASFEITDIPLIKYVASKKKPIIISTGIAELSDIELAVEACRNEGNEDIVLLKCTSSYPAPIEGANLKTIVDLKERFGVVAGLSDHTLGIVSPVVATSLGARVIEKHFILDKSIGGPDASFSLDLHEFKQMVESVRQAEKALGKVDYQLTDKIKESRASTSRSLFISEDVRKGEVLNEKNLRSVRPGYGLHPKYYEEMLGKKVKGDYSKGTPFRLDMVE